jgi:mannitol-1-phosphate/altronate dehydrogenase
VGQARGSIPIRKPEGFSRVAIPACSTTAEIGPGLPLARALDAPRGDLQVPSYDRRALVPSVVHLGVGGFHRSHQAMYFDALAERGVSRGWGVVGVSLRRPAMRDALVPQDCLFTVVERDAHRDAARVVGSMGHCLFAPEDPEAVLGVLTDPRTRLVTLTVTGNGYNVDPATGEFDVTDPAVAAELERPGQPTTAYGYLVEALARRRRANHAPFTVLSCDNVPFNGRVARSAVVSFARLRDELLAEWIDRRAAFPNSMVDRITPETTPDHRRLVLDEFEVRDRSPVVTEPFSQWIVEDDFCHGRPPLEEVGVQFVGDVTAYQAMKTRLLNAGHSAIGYLGALHGLTHTDEALREPVLRGYLAELMEREVAPLLAPAAGIDFAAYQRMLLHRFSNPKIRDPLARLCGRGSTKMPAYLLPSIREARLRGRPHALLTLAVAGWFRYLRGTDCSGRPVEIKDAMGDELQALAVEGGSDPRPLLAKRGVFGELSDDRAFAASVQRALASLERDGVKGAVAAELRREEALAA